MAQLHHNAPDTQPIASRRHIPELQIAIPITAPPWCGAIHARLTMFLLNLKHGFHLRHDLTGNPERPRPSHVYLYLQSRYRKPDLRSDRPGIVHAQGSCHMPESRNRMRKMQPGDSGAAAADSWSGRCRPHCARECRELPDNRRFAFPRKSTESPRVERHCSSIAYSFAG